MTAPTTTAAPPQAAGSGRLARASFLIPLITFLAVLSLVPILFALAMSFTNFRLGSSAELEFVGLANYVAVLSSPRVLAMFGRTAMVLAVALPAQIVLGYLIAKLFYRVRDVPGAGVIRTLYLIPVMLPEIVVGLMFCYMMNPRVGVINWGLGEIGLPQPDWFADPSIAMYTIILLIVWQWGPLSTIILYGGLLGVPHDVREAAQVDGAGVLRQMTAIEIPMLKKMLGLVVLLEGIQLVGTFAIVYITTQGGPGSATTILSFEIYQQAFVFFNTGYGSALSILTLIAVVVLSQLLVRAVFKEEK